MLQLLCNNKRRDINRVYKKRCKGFQFQMIFCFCRPDSSRRYGSQLKLREFSRFGGKISRGTNLGFLFSPVDACTDDPHSTIATCTIKIGKKLIVGFFKETTRRLYHERGSCTCGLVVELNLEQRVNW